MKGFGKILIIFLILIFFIAPFVIEARSGCCSHHGGVCDCRCCDGTFLSSKCAPYYPECKPAPKYSPSEQKSELPEPSKNNSPVTKEDLSVQPYNNNKYTAEVPKESNNFVWWGLVGLILGGLVVYLFSRNKK